MDLFGFEEDLEMVNPDSPTSPTSQKPVRKMEFPEYDEPKLDISQIKELLAKDLNETMNDQDTFQESETSIFDNTTSSPKDPPKLRSHRHRAIEKTFEETSTIDIENLDESEFVVPVIRAYPKQNRKKKVLQSIENTHGNDSVNSTISKPKLRKNNRKGKTKVKNDENENVNSIAEEINKKFKEVEKYKLIVE